MFSFLGIGAQKAGTTWLYTMLSHHPDISFPSGKELHYWNKQYPAKTPDEYLRQFTQTEKLEGEITPAYGHLPLETIRAIFLTAPHTRFFFIIRNPIERAWSSALMALQRAEMTFDEASDAWFIDHFNSKGSLQRSNYEQILRNWKSVFPDEQLLVLYRETLAENPEELLDQCCTHLKIRCFSPEEKRHLPLRKKIFKNKIHHISQRLRKELLNIHESRINSLSIYLNRDLSHWDI